MGLTHGRTGTGDAAPSGGMGRAVAVGLAVAVVSSGILAVSCSTQSDPPSTVILISVDTLRTDHLALYGHDRPTSPFLDRLAETSTVFERAVSTSSWTLPAHASLFLSQYQATHGVIDEEKRIPERATTLAEVLTENGYSTAGFYSTPLVSERHGFEQGFDVYVQPREGSGASAVNAAALDWLDSTSGPRFLFLHFYDVHSPYEAFVGTASFCGQERSARTFREVGFAAARRYLSGLGVEIDSISAEKPRDFFNQAKGRLRGNGLGATEVAEMRKALSLNRDVTPEEQELVVGLYDDGVRFIDSSLSDLFAAFEERNLTQDALVIITADHGEMLYQRDGYRGHTRHLHQSISSVPLLIRAPGQQSGRRVKEPTVSLLDISTTILDYVGIAAPRTFRGRSLRPLIDGQESVRDEPVIIEVDFKGVRSASLISWPFKVVREDHTGRECLFNLDDDPTEDHDLASREPKLLTRLLARLDHRVNREREVAAAPAESTELEPEELERLELLGYVR